MPDTSNFTPTTAIVTASDSGIGKATAVALARARHGRGCHLAFG